MQVSVITPVLDEAAVLPQRAAELAVQEGPWEWIVVDGGSRDGSCDVADSLGARCLRTPRGRGTQLHAGARAAQGEVLLFLHADTSLPTGALAALREHLREAPDVGGNFRLRFEGEGVWDRLLTLCYRWQQHVLGTFYGDSAMFMRTSAYFQVRGCPDIPIMEDYELCLRMRRLGSLAWLPLTVTTSNRRYRARPIATLLRWGTISALYRLGVPATTLAHLYRPHAAPAATMARAPTGGRRP